MANVTNNNDQKRYVLQIERGEELSLHRMDEICDKESIMRPSYEKAMRALVRIMRQTNRFHKDNRDNEDGSDAYALENLLFGYSGNIIAFAAPRGGGKTATMLSFSKILAKGFRPDTLVPVVDNRFLNDMKCGQEEQPDAWLARCCFLPLTPVAPAVLEGEQNILNVVWSRLYRYAERLLSEHRSDRIKEAQKNEIRRSLQKVLSGIKGIKDPEKKFSGDLSSMQDVCDGLSLSRHFHMLVQNILKLAVGDHNYSDRYLVIQLDDADSKMQRVYEVLEDVRKYLMIPNLVILMSVDQNCMSDVVLQDNLRCFPDLIKIDESRLSQDLLKISNKYIDKLIPPTHMIQLPLLNQIVIQWGDMLRLHYVDQNRKHVYGWMEENKLELETAILMLIYRKTGILFVKPGHYLHNMVPRTLRGFGQFLSFLDSMPDVPVLDFDKYADVKAYAEAVLTQSETAAINQRKFEDYFKHRWINVKITNLEDLDFLRKFADTASANQICLAVKHLCKRYGESFEDNKPKYFVDRKIEIRHIKNREDLDHLMYEIDRIHRTETDFLLLFAIRTLFTLNSHQHILKLKRKAAREYLEDPKNKKVLAFALHPQYIYTPGKLVLEEAAKKCKILKKNVAAYDWLLTPLLGDDKFISEVNRMAITDPDIMGLQQLIHKMQDLAVVFYANSDAAYEVRKTLKGYVTPIEASLPVPDSVKAMVDAILKLACSFNDKKLNGLFADLPDYKDRYEETIAILSRSINAALPKPKLKTSKNTKANKQSGGGQQKYENDDTTGTDI